MLTALTNASVIYTGETTLSGKVLLLEGDRIKGITEPGMVPGDAIHLDCDNAVIAPGFIDLQIYGGGGYLFSDNPSAIALKAMADALVQSGTTGFYITLATNSMEVFRQAIRVVKENPHPAVMGLHFEGPYINPARRGAHLIEYIKRPELKEVEALLKEADGVLKMMTLAPEMCDVSILQLLADNGVTLSAGHSNATFEEAVAGYHHGITATTHLFNAMSPLHHRDTGLPGAVFLTHSARASIIADGIHVDFNALQISKKLLQERLFLITDAVVDVRKGAYVHVNKGDRFTLPDGTLSGSNLTLLKAVRNCVEHAGIALDEALRMASFYPAKVIGSKNRGSLQPGNKADLTLFSKKFEPLYTVLDGTVFKHEDPKATPIR